MSSPSKALAREERLHRLFRHSVDEQWSPGKTFEWNSEWDYANPLSMGSYEYEISSPEFWDRIGPHGKAELSRNFQIWRLSQMLYGEQAAMTVCSRLALLHEDNASRMCCAVQAADEARHADVFTRIIRELGVEPHSITRPLAQLLATIEADKRISVLSLGMQVLIEGVGIGAFRRISISSQSAFVRTLFTFIMKDEARHFALGRATVASRERVLDEIPEPELDDFLDESLQLLNDYLTPCDVLKAFGCSLQETAGLVERSVFAKQFRRTVFGQMARPILDLELPSHSRTRRRLSELAGVES